MRKSFIAQHSFLFRSLRSIPLSTIGQLVNSPLIQRSDSSSSNASSMIDHTPRPVVKTTTTTTITSLKQQLPSHSGDPRTLREEVLPRINSFFEYVSRKLV